MQVRLAATRLAEFLKSRGATVHLVSLPDLDDGSKQGVDDYIATGHTVDDVLGCVVEKFSVVVRDGDRPGVLVGSGQLRDQSGQSVSALEKTNAPPMLFVRGGQLVRLRPDENDKSLIEALTENSLRHRLTEIADFFKETKNDARPVAPPLDVVRDILAWTEWPFPPLRGIISAPALRQDGTVILTPGYDAETRVFYAPDSGLEELQPISDHPSVEEIENARDGLLDLLKNFPFVDNASKANALGLILTPFLRPAFDGPIPLALIDAPQPGTGKDLLGDVAGTLATGGSIPSMTAPAREDEWRKQITATLKAGQPVVKIGNVDRELKSSELAAVLTTERWEARELGFSHNVVLENRATWIATGNNIKVGNDMGRRCFRISLDPRSSQPWKRTGFKYPNLLEHIRQHRAIYVGHALTLCRAWFAAGRPPGDAPVIGSYESWCRTLGGILTHAGVAGFLTNLDAFYADADEETTEWVGWLDAWPIEPMTVAQLHDKLQGSGELADTMPSAVAAAMEKTSQGAKIALGKVLKSRAGRRYREDGLRVIPAPPDTHRKTNRWQVIKDDLGPLPADFTIDAESAES